MDIPGFRIVAQNLGRTTYECLACPGRTTVNPHEHLQTQTHLLNVTLVNPIPQPLIPHNEMNAFGRESEPEDAALAFESIHLETGDVENSDDGEVVVPTREAEVAFLNQNQIIEVDFEDEGDWDDSIFEAVNLAHNLPPGMEIAPIETSSRVMTSQWYPYQNREALIGTLINGYMRRSMSRSMYSQLRLIVSITGLQLPHWNTIKNTCESMRNLLDFDVTEHVSIWNNHCYSVSIPKILEHEIANPYVHPHLDFYPEETHGKNVYKLSQSKKWREELGLYEQVQMAVINEKHFYILEPTQLKSGTVVIPLYFFKMKNEIHAKCAQAFISKSKRDPKLLRIEFHGGLEFTSDHLKTIKILEFDKIYSEIVWGDFGNLVQACKQFIWEIGNPTPHTLPNRWRFIANGRVIRHMPINLYADDTSGNISKQFNKHISFYFTLSGLPPNVANQEYNCQFVTTSNQAGVLELADKLTDEMNDLATFGHLAHDYELDQEVLIMSVVLCFQGDSPMHAEVTSTHLPNASLNCCRMCKLKARSIEDRKSLHYIQNFIGRNTQGNVCRPPPPQGFGLKRYPLPNSCGDFPKQIQRPWWTP
ncbi:hypothetical protein PGT21_019355 [Puccinia graminis f. sp. tritici]|uniref:Uncharacterized protein n=1 Tax=Puccinia graminis f. sp. tritici TaxID=56615 RepID=A0A5B0MNF0_PUCGR|nr:hypothetical protein PGT21_019355 [Puccinia graminis f. sp. tritici]